MHSKLSTDNHSVQVATPRWAHGGTARGRLHEVEDSDVEQNN